MGAQIDWEKQIGDRFGRLILLRVYGKGKGQKADLICDCGNLKTTSTKVLRAKDCVSCGCYNRDKVREAATRHGCCTKKLKTKEYFCWRNMHYRCYYDHPQFESYKRKGITMCDRWRYGENGVSGFLCFLSDMGKRPENAQTLDRIDNAKGYYPGNCRWTTFRVQMNNQDCTPLVSYKGEEMPLSFAAEKAGLSFAVIQSRYQRKWGSEKLFQPIMKKDSPLEKEVEASIGRYAKSKGVLYMKFVSPSRRAVPDRMIITRKGAIGFLEIKRLGARPTPLQEREIAKLREHGCIADWCDSVEKGQAFIDRLLAKPEETGDFC